MTMTMEAIDVARRGRPRRSGERYPGGKLKPDASVRGGAAGDRLKQGGARTVCEPRLGTEVGRPLLEEPLRGRQAGAAGVLGRSDGRYEALHGLPRRSAASPDYER